MGALLLVVFKSISFKEIAQGLTADTAINPIKILVLFISMTVLSIFLDEVGFFQYLANATLKKAKSSQFMLFTYLYMTVSVLTIFTSNDIIVLTFTPFISILQKMQTFRYTISGSTVCCSKYMEFITCNWKPYQYISCYIIWNKFC